MAILVSTVVSSSEEETSAMYVMLLMLQPNVSNKEWGAVSQGSSVHLQTWAVLTWTAMSLVD